MNIGIPVTKFEFGDSSKLISLKTSDVLGDEWGEIRNIEVITLKQHLIDKASDEAWKQGANIENIDSILEDLLITKHSHAKEFVSFNDDKIIIGINVSDINNETIQHAFELLSKIDHLQGFHIFGDDIQIYEKQS